MKEWNCLSSHKWSLKWSALPLPCWVNSTGNIRRNRVNAKILVCACECISPSLQLSSPREYWFGDCSLNLQDTPWLLSSTSSNFCVWGRILWSTEGSFFHEQCLLVNSLELSSTLFVPGNRWWMQSKLSYFKRGHLQSCFSPSPETFNSVCLLMNFC